MKDEQAKTRRQWVRRLLDPDEPLTLEEFGQVPAAILLQEQPLLKMVTGLDAAAQHGEPMTIMESLILVLFHLRENTKDTRLGTQHVEGMVGTLDDFLQLTNETYQELAAKRAKPVPALPPNGGQP